MTAVIVGLVSALIVGAVLATSWWWAQEQHNRQIEMLKIRRAEMDASWHLHRQTVDAFAQMLRTTRASRIAEQHKTGRITDALDD